MVQKVKNTLVYEKCKRSKRTKVYEKFKSLRAKRTKVINVEVVTAN